MSDATLWVLFIANAIAIVGLVVVAVHSRTKVDYSIYIPPTTVELPDEVDVRREIDLRDELPAPREELTDLHMRQPHRVGND